MTQRLQENHAPLEAGLLLLPAAVAMIVTSVFAPRLAKVFKLAPTVAVSWGRGP